VAPLHLPSKGALRARTPSLLPMRNLTLCDDGTNALCAEEDPKGLAVIALIGMNFLGTTARTSISMIDLDPPQKHRDLLPLISVGRGTCER